MWTKELDKKIKGLAELAKELGVDPVKVVEEFMREFEGKG